MKITAVVVTHNRFELLKACIASLQSQHLPLSEIIVINNGSTDGTAEWLSTQQLTVLSQENIGASGGFFNGIKLAYEKGADWIWVLDDDTIPEPTALSELMKPLQLAPTEKFGYLVSKAIWTDGEPHLMNIPDIKPLVNGIDSNKYAAQGFTLSYAASFVSLLVNRDAVTELGYPIREFFIWGDDTEYTTRMTNAGWLGAYVPSSVVLHKTVNNYSADIYAAKPNEQWKHFYGIRNKLFCRRIWKGEFSFWSNVLKGFIVIPFRIIRKRKDNRFSFVWLQWKATAAAIGFKPTIQKP